MNPDSSDLRYIMEKILILDFGSQYTQLIARRVRELSVYCEIHPFNKIPALDASVRGVILSGSPFSVRDENAPTPDLSAIKGKLPLLGVCYGAQFLASAFGGEVQPAPSREYGRAMLTVGDADLLTLMGDDAPAAETPAVCNCKEKVCGWRGEYELPRLQEQSLRVQRQGACDGAGA